MLRQNKIRKDIFANAVKQLGRRSLVQPIYEDCVDFYPDQGVSRIGRCVRARLTLRDKLDDEAVEREIYRRCDAKWRIHGAGAIANCSTHAANFYRRKGYLRD